MRPHPMIEPFIDDNGGNIGPRDQALAKMPLLDGLLIAFDVWWATHTPLEPGKKEKGPCKGFMAQPSAEWFYTNVQTKVPLEARAFYQVFDANRTCAWYFDIDADIVSFPIVEFLHALFEEMCHENQNLTVEGLWRDTLLLDATCNIYGIPKKASCHGVCNTLIFNDNHTDMKEFATRVKQRLEQRSDNESFRIRHKSGKMIIPLDLSVYSTYRCFRMYGNVKMTDKPEDRRPLIVASYNRCANMAPDELGLFLQSIIAQPNERPAVVAAEMVPSAAKRQKTTTRTTATVSSSSQLENYLLSQLYQWGNSNARVNQVKPANKSPECLYVGFAYATDTPTHSHNTNTVFAIVDIPAVTIHWNCHKGSTKCARWSQPLPMEIALTLI